MPNSGKPNEQLKGYTSKSPIARVVGYAENVAKESKQAVKGLLNTTGAQIDSRSYPPARRDEMISKANAAGNSYNKDLGQLAGAVLQGRRYDSKGRQV
jgi:hypothetical protein